MHECVQLILCAPFLVSLFKLPPTCDLDTTAFRLHVMGDLYKALPPLPQSSMQCEDGVRCTASGNWMYSRVPLIPWEGELGWYHPKQFADIIRPANIVALHLNKELNPMLFLQLSPMQSGLPYTMLYTVLFCYCHMAANEAHSAL